jgi:hypothetical protein
MTEQENTCIICGAEADIADIKEDLFCIDCYREEYL